MAAIRLLSGIFGGDWPNWGHEDPNQGLSAPFNRSKRQGQVRTSTSYWGALPLTHLLATHHVIVRLVADDAWCAWLPRRRARAKAGDEAQAPPVPPRPVHEPMRERTRRRPLADSTPLGAASWNQSPLASLRGLLPRTSGEAIAQF